MFTDSWPLQLPLIIQPVIVKGKGKFYITKTGTDQTGGEISTSEQCRLQKPRHSGMNYRNGLQL